MNFDPINYNSNITATSKEYLKLNRLVTDALIKITKLNPTFENSNLLNKYFLET